MRAIISITLVLAAFGGWSLYAVSRPVDFRGRLQIEASRTVPHQLREQGFPVPKIIGDLYLALRFRFAFNDSRFAGHGSGVMGQGSTAITITQPISLRSLTGFIFNSSGMRQEIELTIPEGWTAEQIASYVGELFGADAVKQFRQAVRRFPADWRRRYPSLAGIPLDGSLEGYLFPDTYRFYRDTSGAEIAERLVDEFQERWSHLLAAVGSNRDPRQQREALIIASIVEREVRGDADRRLVAGIFWDRLDRGMALQADSTVNYVTGGKSLALNAAELATDSPYNTYRRTGLPPGPISNPGESSWRATLKPTSSPYLFFLTTPDGQAIYSRTAAEQEAAKKRYLR